MNNLNMKHLKNFNNFERTDESVMAPVFFGLGTILGTMTFFFYILYIQPRIPFLSDKFFKNIKRWIQMSKAIKKYNKLLIELDQRFKDDPNLNDYYNSIKKLGDDTIGHQNQTHPIFYTRGLKRYILKNPGYQNQTHPNFFARDLKRYILKNVPDNKKTEVEEMFGDMEKEFARIVPSLFDEDGDDWDT